MVISSILQKAVQILDRHGIEDSYNEALVLLTYAADCSKTYIFTHADKRITSHIENLFFDYIEKRSLRMPVAYIVGKAWFMSLEFAVSKSTLIPRPETEGLVEEVLKLLKDSEKKNINILDICTGTGCIGISVAYYDGRTKVCLMDNNQNCINIAKENIADNNLESRVEAVNSNLFEKAVHNKYHIITANPPYIPSGDILTLDDDVKFYEPASALDGGCDGMGFYKKIISDSPRYLDQGGYLVLESGIGQADNISKLLKSNGFKIISINNDLSGIPRVISAKIQNSSQG